MNDDEKEILLIFLEENVKQGGCLPLFPVGIKSCLKKYGKIIKSMLCYVNVLLIPGTGYSCPKRFEDFNNIDYEIDQTFLKKYSEIFKRNDVFLIHVRKNLDRKAINEALKLRKLFLEDFPEANLKGTYLLYYLDNKNLREYAMKANLIPFRVELYIYY